MQKVGATPLRREQSRRSPVNASLTIPELSCRCFQHFPPTSSGGPFGRPCFVCTAGLHTVKVRAAGRYLAQPRRKPQAVRINFQANRPRRFLSLSIHAGLRPNFGPRVHSGSQSLLRPVSEDEAEPSQ